jgi:hypothetical protein
MILLVSFMLAAIVAGIGFTLAPMLAPRSPSLFRVARRLRTRGRSEQSPFHDGRR